MMKSKNAEGHILGGKALIGMILLLIAVLLIYFMITGWFSNIGAEADKVIPIGAIFLNKIFKPQEVY